ncbi:MAG: 4a-hydroxytetrahydrobiopterin dehydratase [Candidatus Methylopumilus sp.]|nr:4a-hydroxytetrahydrobiopterin dehydratase [Candidatus Methylopumilus sp.]
MIYTIEKIQKKLRSQLDGWTYESPCIKKTIKTQNFNQAIDIANQIAKLADTSDHHPDLKITYTSIVIELMTHDKKGITDKDFNLADQINKILY